LIGKPDAANMMTIKRTSGHRVRGSVHITVP
jgi:hypothetical protein